MIYQLFLLRKGRTWGLCISYALREWPLELSENVIYSGAAGLRTAKISRYMIRPVCGNTEIVLYIMWFLHYESR